MKNSAIYIKNFQNLEPSTERRQFLINKVWLFKSQRTKPYSQPSASKLRECKEAIAVIETAGRSCANRLKNIQKNLRILWYNEIDTLGIDQN